MRIVKYSFIFIAFIFISSTSCSNQILISPYFSGGTAYQHIEAQLEFGPRFPGSEGHQLIQSWIVEMAIDNGWEVRPQSFWNGNVELTNFILFRNDLPPDIILGAHYDTRQIADADPGVNPSNPVLGANDGASGVAVLLELARVLPEDLPNNVWIVFFDAEDNGNIAGWDWIMGSRYFVENLVDYPAYVVILDMIGDEDLQIYYEFSSSSELNEDIWNTAASMGYQEVFVPEVRYHIIDDHSPFLQVGIQAVDIIDFDYPYWHTSNDTLEHISAESLAIVGNTVFEWLLNLSELP